MPAPHKDWVAAFWAFVRADVETGCWIWQGATQGRNGEYGQFGSRGKGCRKGQTTLAHRIAWELLRGPIADGLTIDHLCRVPLCVNPDHLEPVTRGENVRRGAPAQATHCVNGHPLVGYNVYRDPTRGRRQCRTCRRDAMRRHDEKRRHA